MRCELILPFQNPLVALVALALAEWRHVMDFEIPPHVNLDCLCRVDVLMHRPPPVPGAVSKESLARCALVLLGDNVITEYPVTLCWTIAERLQRRLNHVVLEHVVTVRPHNPAAFAGQVVGFFKCHISRGGEVIEVRPMAAEW